MAEVAAREGKLIDHLKALIELDLDAIEAYEAAIGRLHDLGDKAQLERFMGDHARHVVDLSFLVQQAGGSAPTQPDFKRILTKGKVILRGVVGDAGVIKAMKSNEETSTRVYDRAKSDPDLPIRAKTIIEANYADERQHLAWMDRRLSVLRGQT
jgi:hypothetical protein